MHTSNNRAPQSTLKFLLISIGAMIFSPQSLAEEYEAIRSSLNKLNADMDAVAIQPSGVPNISTVTIGMQVMYITNDGSYVFGGPLIDADSGTNLTDKTTSVARALLLESSEVPLFKYASDNPNHRITVITDIDCPHCRRLHNEIPQLQELGVEVNYVMLPRAGKNSPSYTKTVSAACAEQPEVAITTAMLGKTNPTIKCQSPIDQHMRLARQLNITSTPAIMFEDGHLELGYKSADRLIGLLNKHFTGDAID